VHAEAEPRRGGSRISKEVNFSFFFFLFFIPSPFLLHLLDSWIKILGGTLGAPLDPQALTLDPPLPPPSPPGNSHCTLAVSSPAGHRYYGGSGCRLN